MSFVSDTVSDLGQTKLTSLFSVTFLCSEDHYNIDNKVG